MSDVKLREAQRQAEELPEVLERYRTQLLRSCSFLECWLCGVLVPEQLMPEHDKACMVMQAPSYDGRVPATIQTFIDFGAFRPTQEAQQQGATVVPAGRGIHFRPRREPLYDTEPLIGPVGARAMKAVFYIRGTLSETSCRFLVPARCSKDPWLTNIPPGVHDALPLNQHFYWYRAALVPDMGQDSEAVLHVWQHGIFRFLLQETTLLEWPCMAVMTDPKNLPKESHGELTGLAAVRPRVNVTIQRNGVGNPVHIEPQVGFDFSLAVKESPKVPLPFTVLMYGIRMQPIAG